MFYTTISTLDKVPENVLIYIYQGILEVAEEIRAGNKDEAQNKIKKMADVLMMIRKQEEMERERE
ncbi:MAG: hypothetical protein WCP92_01820 [bacterium]